MSSVLAKQDSFAARYLLIPDAQERLSALVHKASKQCHLSVAEKTESNRVQGCQSAVWLVGEDRDGHCHFRSDADSPMIKALVSVLCEIYDGATPEEVVTTEPEIFQRLQLWETLSPTRQNGLRSVRETICRIAQGLASSGL